MNKKERELRKYLRDMTKAVDAHLKAIDVVMNKPESHQRGREIAALCNQLELQNDIALRFGLGIDRAGKKVVR